MATTDTAAPQSTGTYADVNGLHLYYETEGGGRAEASEVGFALKFRVRG